MKLWNIPSFVYKYSMYFNAHQPKNKNARVKIVHTLSERGSEQIIAWLHNLGSS